MSPSQIDRAEESPLGWFIDRVGAPPSGLAASIGTLVHAVVEEAGARTDGDTSIETLWAAVEERWRELRFEAGWVAERERRGARRMAEGAADYLANFADDGKVLLGAEGRFTLVVDRVRLTGTIDRVEASPDGTTVIVDLKTGRTPPTAAQTAQHPQLAAYQLAARGGEVPNAGTLGGAKLVYLAKPVRGLAFSERAQQPFDDEAEAAFRERLAAVARTMSGSEFEGPGRARLPLPVRRMAVPRAPRSGGERMSPATVPTAHIGALEIAERLGLHAPTAEQRAVIEADPFGASIVVAGAGSGKTETMANRVVWMLANGHVSVPEVLGLTFTRKAAGELAERIRERVGQLVAEGIAQVELDPLESAAVGTYNAFASSIYREHAMLIGREPDAAVLGEASAWMLARSVSSTSADPRLVELDASLDRVTAAVLALSRALAENVADSRDVQAFARDFLAMQGLPIEAPRKRTDFDTFTDALGVVGALPPLLDLADAYAAAKRERGYVEFSDQVALALSICERHPEVVAAHRERGAHRAARRVPGHERGADPAARDVVPRALGHGRRRPRPVDLRMARRERRQPRALLERLRRARRDGRRVRPLDELAQPEHRARRRQRHHRAARRGHPEGAARALAVRG